MASQTTRRERYKVRACESRSDELMELIYWISMCIADSCVRNITASNSAAVCDVTNTSL